MDKFIDFKKPIFDIKIRQNPGYLVRCNMKKILFVIESLGGGGAEKVLIDILNHLDKFRYDITVCTLFNVGVYIDKIPDHIHYKTIIKKPTKVKNALFWRLLKYLPRKWAYRLFIRDKYDVEIAFTEGLETMLLSGSNCPNKIAWVHTDLIHFDWISRYHRSEKHLLENYQQYNSIVFVSKEAKESFEKRFGPFENCSVIYNLIDKNLIRQRSTEFLPVHRYDAPVVCAVGRFIPIKGFLRLLRVHKKLIDENIPHELWFLGTGNEEEKMKDFVAKNNLENSVSFFGFQTNPYPYLLHSDIFVSSSVAEGFSLVVAEALTLQKPIVSTRCTGPTEILANGKYGVLVENSEEGLYQGIHSLLTDKAFFLEAKEKAILGSEQFNPKKTIQQIETLF